MAEAPFCYDSKNQPPIINQPTPKNMPSIPKATNDNFLQVINQMRTIINNFTSSNPFGRYTELTQYRVTQNITFNPALDGSITFQRIVRVVMQDNITGEYWTWNWDLG